MNLKVLGSGQDGGIPHIGCRCSACNRARRDPRYRRFGPSIAVFDTKAGFCYLIDASPDFKPQLDMIRKEIRCVKRKGKIPVSGILLTHAHFGHYTGLWQLGKETLDENQMPIFCTSSMQNFLSASPPFEHLIRDGNMTVRKIRPNVEVALDELRIEPIRVPHRSEITDAVGYVIQAARRVAYIPDTDYWTDDLIEEIAVCDIALIDGTFYSLDELPRFEEVRHPPIKETLHVLKDLDTEIFFTHINHTNPVNRNGRARKDIEDKGFRIARDGLMVKSV